VSVHGESGELEDGSVGADKRSEYMGKLWNPVFDKELEVLDGGR
jgi:hypothetical protein